MTDAEIVERVRDLAKGNSQAFDTLFDVIQKTPDNAESMGALNAVCAALDEALGESATP